METNNAPPGRFVWYDLMVADEKAGLDFYNALVGWGAQPFAGQEPYMMFTREEIPLGGVMALEKAPPNTPPHWLGYVHVSDIDASTARAKELGGEVMHPPTDIPDVGRFSVISDPQGAVICLFEPGGVAPGHAGPGRVGEFSWHELGTSDLDAAVAFYTALFGWEKGERMEMDEGSYQLLRRAGADFDMVGVYRKNASSGDPAWLVYINVPDVAATMEACVRLGGKSLAESPIRVPGGLIAPLQDAQGAYFAVHSYDGEGA